MSSSSYDDTDSTTGHESPTKQQQSQKQQQQQQQGDAVIGKAETKDVARLRFVVAIVLVCSAIGVALSVYYYIKGSEDWQFQTQFEDDSEKVLQAIGSSLDHTVGLLDGLAVTLVSFARYTNQTWPCVSLPNFAVRMSKVVPLTDAVNINVLPIVTDKTRLKWEAYTSENDDWVDETVTVQDNWDGYYGPVAYNGIHNHVVHDDFVDLPYNTSRNMLPLWQNFPVIANTTFTFNWDWLATSVASTYDACITKHKAVVSKPYLIPDPNNPIEVAETQAWAEYYASFISPDEVAEEPMSDLVYPIVDEVDRVVVTGAGDYEPAQHDVVGMLGSSFYWRSLLRDILPKGSNGIQVLFENPCTLSFAYEIHGPEVVYLGVNHQHEAAFESMGKSQRLDQLLGKSSGRNSVYTGAPIDDEHCPITLRVYPSAVMKAIYTTKDSTIFTLAAVAIFAFTSLVFYCYDSKVERRQEKVLRTAVQSSAIVSSLFPSKVRDRLYNIAEENRDKEETAPTTTMSKLRTSFAPVGRSSIIGRSSSLDMKNMAMSMTASDSPIADLYLDTTVLFADIVGFTAWSSVRNPIQVFCLLETIYAAFDEIAKRRGVFKVETIGDSYVAVVGLPTPRKHHAVVMARFANDCRTKMQVVTRELDEVLGPGTSDLSMRFGLNSGPTTAGVLRGEKSRFQLFGDTVNTAARMESNGMPGAIQVSQKTADLITAAGKGQWLTPRPEKIKCKGKGLMTTFWVNPRSGDSTTTGSILTTSEHSMTEADCEASSTVPTTDVFHTRSDALVTWNYNLFMGLLNDVVAYREANGTSGVDLEQLPVDWDHDDCGTPRDEVQEVLELPRCDVSKLKDTFQSSTSSSSMIGAVVSEQLFQLVTTIANLYKNNPFHNFDHCCHVVMSTKKLLDRMSELDTNATANDGDDLTRRCSDAVARNPLSRLAIVFAALVHDVDHPGVSNALLVEEFNEMAVSYGGKSVAEQNSISVAWKLLMQPQFTELRGSLFANNNELHQFRAILVNAVLATDLFDPMLQSTRDARWTKSFAAASSSTSVQDVDSNRRATIVIDLIIQASDVSHTMQHFTVYKKWNQRLLTEMYDAYACGRTTKDPLDGWYEAELAFFDTYVIPLAQKLHECGVFGVSCDEFLDYAKDNRMEWETKGRDIVQEAADSFKRPSKDDAPSTV